MPVMSLVAVLTMAAAAPPVPTPSLPAPASPTTVQGVTVTAPRLDAPGNASDKAQVEQKIDSFSAATGDGRIARWAEPVCPVVEGAPAAFGGFVIDRMEADAAEVGAPRGEAGCNPNVLIVFTGDPDKAVADLAARRRETLVAGAAISDVRVQRFLRSRAPVRIFRSTDAVSTNGGQWWGRQIGGATVSRVNTYSEMAFTRVVLVVDMARIQGMKQRQVADYLSLLTLGDVAEPQSAFRPQTIANLFVEPDRVDALTDWDRGYLKAVYAGAGHGARNRAVQIGRMAAFVDGGAR